ncbi:MAG TPA: hypothetical protein VK576_04765 [Thermoleophilia bacterium]|nr:hypothetical protein [Thermoleophilia bacterium]
MVRLAIAAAVVTSALGLALTPAGARADDTSLGATGGSARPLWSAHITLKAETVQAVCYGAFAQYRVDFLFVNDGPRQRVHLGFPFRDTVGDGGDLDRPVGFQAWRESMPLTVTTTVRAAANGDRTGYFVHDAVFPHGSTTITVSYLAAATFSAISRQRAPQDKSGMASAYQYWLHTGATWQGTIGSAVVRYRLADTFNGRDIDLSAGQADEYAPITTPLGWTSPLPATYQWRFDDFEPLARAARGEWWKTQSPYDVTLAFTVPFEPVHASTTWTSSSVAAGFGDLHQCWAGDGDLRTCWAEGVPGLGRGEWVQASFRRPRRLRELRIVTGNNAYTSAFTRFARPRTMTAVFSDGTTRLLRLADSATLQQFPVDVTTSSVRLVIGSVYRGTDYPATCVSEVELGSRPAPGFAPFARLLADPAAVGRLAAQAGPPPPPPVVPWGADRQETWDYDSYAGGDLLGLGSTAFPADDAPFRQPSSLRALLGSGPALHLPPGRLVGRVDAVNALSYHTFQIRYSSGVELLINTRLRPRTVRSIVAELAAETSDLHDSGVVYTDGRHYPFVLAAVGDRDVGVAAAGITRCADESCSGDDDLERLPAQVFWRDRDVSYHLYARSPSLGTDQLVAVARSMIEPASAAPAPSPHTAGAARWAGRLLGATVLSVLAVAAVVVRRQRVPAVTAPPD